MKQLSPLHYLLITLIQTRKDKSQLIMVKPLILGQKIKKKKFVTVRGKKHKNKDNTLSEAIQLTRGVIGEDVEKSRQDVSGGMEPAAIC